MADEGKNIRSVIKNATQWGLSSRLWGTGDTIATKEEITQNKEKPETPKMSVWPKLGLQWPVSMDWLKQKLSSDAGRKELFSQVKQPSPSQDTSHWVSVSQQAPVSSPFENNINTPINNINVEQINNQTISKWNNVIDIEKDKPITAKLKELEKDRVKRMSKGIENLYIDAYNKWVKGEQLTLEMVLWNKNYQKQLKGIDENVLKGMIDDANYLAQWDYDTNNVLALMDKYKELGLKMDLDSLPPQTKAQYIAANLEWNDGGLLSVIDHISPMNIPGEIYEKFTGTNPRDYNEKLQQWAEQSKHDFLTDKELNEMIEDQVKQLDEQYKKYYTNDLELVDKDLQRKLDLEYDKWLGSQMVTTPEQRKAKKEELLKSMGFQYMEREGKNWKDPKMKKEYEKKLKELEDKAKEAHWDTAGNWWWNLWMDATLVVGQGLDLVRNPWSLASGLASFVKWAGHKSIEWYADLLDTVVATVENVADKDKSFKIEYRTDSIWEKVARAKGYENYEDMVMKMEQASKDNPWLKIATWFLKQWEKDLNTANALGDYLVNAYGSWENVKEMANENQAQMASDIVSIIQLGTMWAVKMWLIDAVKGEQIIKMAWYGDLYEQTLKWGNKLQFWPVLKSEMAVGKLWAKIIWKPLKIGKNFLEVFVNKLSGISKEEREFIKKNPDLVDEFLKWDKNSQSLLDKIKERFDGLQLEKKLEGEEYEKLRTSNKPVEISEMLNQISKRLKEAGLEFNNEWVKVNRNYTPAINRKFEEMGTFLDELRKLWNSATAEDVWWARRQIDTLAKWEWVPAGLEADAIGLIRDVRGILDAELKKQIPDMKVLDDSYKKTIAEIKEMKQDWFNKDGTLKDSAYSKIRNLTNKGSNQPKLARLEKLLPWITQELKGLAVAESIERAGKQMVGQYANQIFGVWGWITAITSLMSGWLSAWPIVLGILWATLATPKNLVKLLKYQGKISESFDKIKSKILNGIKLTPAETQEFTKYINDNQKELKKDAKYLYEKWLITDEEYKAALKNEEKEVKNTWNVDEKPYNSENNLNSNQKKDGVIKESKNDTWKGEKNLWWLAKKEKGIEQWGLWEKTSWQAWNDGGRVSQKDWGYLEMNTDWDKVVENLEKIKASNPDWFKMDIHWSADYGNGKRKTFQSKDGMSSVTVKEDGDITSLVSKPWLKRGKELVLTAIKNGGDKLDCYEEYLPTMYQNAGFEPVARVKFNPEYAPKDWKGKWQDIIVMMRRNNDSVEKVAENWWNYEKIDLDNLPVMEYDDALAYRDSLLAERKMREGVEKWESKGLTKKKQDAKEFLNKNVSKKELVDNIKIYDDAKVEYDEYLDNMAKEVWWKPIKTSIKLRTLGGEIRNDGIDRTLVKQKQKGGKIWAVKDIVRGSIIVDNMEGINKAVTELEKQGEDVDNKFKNPTALGYKDISYNKEVSNGVQTEVQINIPEMLVAKEWENIVEWGWIDKQKYDEIEKKAGVKGGEGHKFYNIYRDIDAGYKDLMKEMENKIGKEWLGSWDKHKIEKLKKMEAQMKDIEEASMNYYKSFEDLIE